MEYLKISDQDHEYWFGDKKVAGDMQKHQLDKKMYFKLKFLDFKNSNMTNIGVNFKPKVIQKQTEPVWPTFFTWVA